MGPRPLSGSSRLLDLSRSQSTQSRPGTARALEVHEKVQRESKNLQGTAVPDPQRRGRVILWAYTIHLYLFYKVYNAEEE